jgi:hypothetical protein
VDDPNNFSIDFGDRNSFFNPDTPLIDPPIIRVYLASPLTNTGVLGEECAQVRAAIKLAFADYEYLGVKFHIYDPADHTSPNSTHSPEDVYVIDHRCTVCADLVVFLVNAPSLGVGIEAQLSASATTPRIIIKKRAVAISRLFQGMCCSTIAEIQYDVPGEVYATLQAQLSEICPKVIESVERRRATIGDIEDQGIGKLFLRQRIRHGVSRPDLAKRTDVPEWWLAQLESCPEFACTISIAQMFRIANALNCNANFKNGKIHIVDHVDLSKALPTNQMDSLNNLVEFVASCENVSEQRVFELWSDYLAEDNRRVEQASAHRSSGHQGTVSPSDWRKRYDERRLFG